MDFELSAEDRALRDEARSWLSDHAGEIREIRETLARADATESFERLRAWERTLNEGNWGAIAWPAKYGGRGASLVQQAIFAEEYALAGAPEGRVNRLGLGLLGPTLMALGTEAQRERHLAKILACDEVWCQGFSEPDAGSDLAALRTSAVRDGDHFIVNGQKIWTTFANFADWIFLLVRTDPAAPKHKGITYLLVDMRTPGIETRPINQINGGTSFSETFFTDVRVPVANVVGEINDGWKVAMTTLGFERGTGLGSPAAFTSIWEQVVDMSLRHSRHGAPAAEDPDIRRRVAQAYIETRVFELNTARVLTALAKGNPLGSEASLSKLYWSEMDARLYELGNDIMGAEAELMEGADGSAGEWFHDYLYARASMIYAGTSEIQKNIIAQRVLGLPRS